MPVPVYNFADRVQQAGSIYDLSEVGSDRLFLGLYRDEGDQLLASSDAHDLVMVTHLRQTAADRLDEICTHLRVSPEALSGIRLLVLRDPHFAGISSSIASEPALCEILYRVSQASPPTLRSLVLEDVHLPELVRCYPQIEAPLAALTRSTYLQELTLNDSTVPCSIFTHLPSLVSLSLQNVRLDSPLHTPSPGSQVCLKHLSFQNSTEVMRRLLFSPSGLNMTRLESVSLDLGSEAAAELSWILLHTNASTVHTLLLNHEPNSDATPDTTPNFDISQIALPNLRILEISDTNFPLCPLALSLLHSLPWWSPASPHLTHIQLSLNGVPFLPPLTDAGTDQALRLGRTIRSQTYASIDTVLSHLCGTSNGSLASISVQLAFTTAPLPAIDDIQHLQYLNKAESGSDAERAMKTAVDDALGAFLEAEDEEDPSGIAKAKKGGLEEAFLICYFPKLSAARSGSGVRVCAGLSQAA